MSSCVEEQNGYNPADFEVPPNDVYMCAICLGVVKDATEITDCGHIFCDICIRQWLKNSSTCPVDRTKINKHGDGIRKSQFVRNLVLNFTMICKCGAKHSVRNLQEHKNVCKKEVLSCDICKKSVKKALYDAHFADQMAEHFEILFSRVQTLEGQTDQKESTSDVKSLKTDLKKLREEEMRRLEKKIDQLTRDFSAQLSAQKTKNSELEASVKALEKLVYSLQSEPRKSAVQPKSEEKQSGPAEVQHKQKSTNPVKIDSVTISSFRDQCSRAHGVTNMLQSNDTEYYSPFASSFGSRENDWIVFDLRKSRVCSKLSIRCHSTSPNCGYIRYSPKDIQVLRSSTSATWTLVKSIVFVKYVERQEFELNCNARFIKLELVTNYSTSSDPDNVKYILREVQFYE